MQNLKIEPSPEPTSKSPESNNIGYENQGNVPPTEILKSRNPEIPESPKARDHPIAPTAIPKHRTPEIPGFPKSRDVALTQSPRLTRLTRLTWLTGLPRLTWLSRLTGLTGFPRLAWLTRLTQHQSLLGEFKIPRSRVPRGFPESRHQTVAWMGERAALPPLRAAPARGTAGSLK